VCTTPLPVVAGLRLITPAVSVGGVDSLIQHPVSPPYRLGDPDDRRTHGIGYRLLRLSVGIEDADDV
jgi:methionine-gamma-lyase